MLEELADSLNRLAKGDLADLEDAFRELHRSHPELSFPDCVGLYEKEHGVKLNNLHVNHALRGYEQA